MHTHMLPYCRHKLIKKYFSNKINQEINGIFILVKMNVSLYLYLLYALFNVQQKLIKQITKYLTLTSNCVVKLKIERNKYNFWFVNKNRELKQ